MMIDSYGGDDTYAGWRIYARWVARDKGPLWQQMTVNHSRFFQELESLNENEFDSGIDYITGMTFDFEASGGNTYWDWKTYAKLDLFPNGLYLYDWHKRGPNKSYTLGDLEYDYSSLVLCGVWDYEGNEIILEGGVGSGDTEERKRFPMKLPITKKEWNFANVQVHVTDSYFLHD